MNKSTQPSNIQKTLLKHCVSTISCFSLFWICGVTQAATTNAESFIQATEHASQRMDTTALQQQVQQAQKDYDFAFANYSLAIAAMVQQNHALTSASLEAAAERLEQLTKSTLDQTTQAEAYALLASIQGMQAGLNPLKGAYYGPLASKSLAKAKAIEGNNARVLLISAITSFQTPNMWGGDKKTALEQANAAISAFNQPCNNICWGKAEAYVWRGLTKQSLGDVAGAKSDWTDALQLSPEYVWPKQLLSQQ